MSTDDVRDRMFEHEDAARAAIEAGQLELAAVHAQLATAGAIYAVYDILIDVRNKVENVGYRIRDYGKPEQ